MLITTEPEAGRNDNAPPEDSLLLLVRVGHLGELDRGRRVARA